MSRLLKASLLLLSLSLISSLYYTYSLFLDSSILKGAHRTLQHRLQHNQLALERSQQALKQTQKELKASRQKLAKMEAAKPKGARKLANRASKIPLIGTIASVGLLAADGVEAVSDCYDDPQQCQQEVESLYREGKENAGRGLEFANSWLSEQLVSQ